MAAKTITLRRTTSVPDLSDFSTAPVQCSPSFQDELRVYQETNYLANALCGMHIEEGPTGAQCFGASHSDLSASGFQLQSGGSRASSVSSLSESPYVVGTPLPGTAAPATAADLSAVLAPHVPGVRLPCNPFLPPFAS